MQKKFTCTLQCGLPTTNDPNKIIVHGAREHNLKNICFQIPKGKLVALTGLSGSGKSSIAVEVLQKECLRQYLESLGMTTDHITKAKVDSIMGLSPSIGISQRVTDFNPRSTVGTKTGILAILRNLFATIGRQICTGCSKNIKQPLQEKSKLTTIETNEKIGSSSKKIKRSYFDCPHCKQQLETLKMAHFSFNTIVGTCKTCKGIGETISVDISSLLNEKKSIQDGGVTLWDQATARYYEKIIQTASIHYQFNFDTTAAIQDYTNDQKNFLLHGITHPEFISSHKHIKEPKKVSEGRYEGIVPYLLKRYNSNAGKVPSAIKRYIVHSPCWECHNTRLGKIGREVTVNEKTITDVVKLNLKELHAWVNNVRQHISDDEQLVLTTLSDALKERIGNLIEVGLDYLSLDRTLPSLSMGESQRVRLACVLGSGLTGVLYILDEPTTGLHPHDTAKLLKTLRMIQKAGNTVLVIEHDPDIIEKVDYIIDVGPGGGSLGGNVVAAGTPAEISACSISTTGKYLTKKIPHKDNNTHTHKNNRLIIHGAHEHNLNNVDVSIPINQFVVLTGVSGSGKSTFLFEVLAKVAQKHFNHANVIPGKHTSVEGLTYLNRVVTVDQSSIRKTKSSRSNVATYTKLFDLIRDLFASLPAAKARSFGADKFSFNASDERCDNCNGAGIVAVDMAFMPDVETLCPTCNGMRFSEEILSIKYQEHNIANILDMTVNDAMPLFSNQKRIISLLKLMKEVGLEYLTLGQSTSTLSGGEAQRIKLAMELCKSGKKSTLYLLDEPTTGLHPQQVETLLNILKKLVEKGNTVVIIEHNLDAIAQADTIIDFGPGGGITGGNIVATGTPQELITRRNSLTGLCLKTCFEN